MHEWSKNIQINVDDCFNSKRGVNVIVPRDGKRIGKGFDEDDNDDDEDDVDELERKIRYRVWLK